MALIQGGGFGGNRGKGFPAQDQRLGMQYTTVDIQMVNNTGSQIIFELFRSKKSQLDVFNQVNGQNPGYYPLAPVAPAAGVGTNQTGGINTPIAIADGRVANQYYWLTGRVNVDTFVNTTGKVPPAGYSTTNYVFLDNQGNLNYSPGYANGVAPAGVAQATVQTPNVTYEQLFKWHEKNEFLIKKIKLTYTPGVSGPGLQSAIGNQLKFVHDAISGDTKTTTITPKNYQQTIDFQNNIVEMPKAVSTGSAMVGNAALYQDLDIFMDANTGLLYPVNNTDTVVMTLEFYANTLAVNGNL